MCKRELDLHYSKNFDKYIGIASNILKNSKYKYNDLKSELVNDSYEYLSKQDITEFTPSLLDSYVINFMNKQVKWRSSKFEINLIKDWTSNEPDIETDTEINNIPYVETDMEYEDEITNKMEHITKKALYLDYTGRRLYDLAIIGPYNNSGKLSKFLKLNRTACYFMIKDIKIYLKSDY
jgi:hypothetical protein